MKKSRFILCSFLILLCALQFPIIAGNLSFMYGDNPDHQPQILKPSISLGPNPIWNRTFGGIGTDEGWDVIGCSDGGYAIAGQSDSFGAGDMDLWVIRLDYNGDQVWAYTYGGTDLEEGWGDIVQCSDAGFIVAGRTRSYGAGSSDVWVLRIDSAGQHMWNQTFGGASHEYASGIIPCSGGGFAISGTTYSFGLGPSDVWLIRIDDAGNHLWNRTYGGASGEYGGAVVECTGGGFAITGSTYNSTTDYDALLVRTDSLGNLLWNQTYGGDDYDRTGDIIQSVNGGFALLGTTESYVGASDDVWLIRTNAAGDLMWNRTYDGHSFDFGYGLVESNNDFVLVGVTTGDGDDVWVIRTDIDGIAIWNGTFSSGTHSSDVGIAIIEAGGGYIITGRTSAFGAQYSDLWLLRLPELDPPTWQEQPTDQTIIFGAPLHYDLNATDPSGISTWWLNDTTNFAINNEGIVSNLVTLAVGQYPLHVSVNDTAGNLLEGTFSVFVQPGPTAPPIPGFPVGTIILGLIIAITLGLVSRRHRKEEP